MKGKIQVGMSSKPRKKVFDIAILDLESSPLKLAVRQTV